jgi:hypothetical protein
LTLTAELTRLRQRGIDNLEIDTPQQPAVDLPLLEQLARRYSGQPGGSRTTIIRRFVADGLTSWQQERPAQAAVARQMFFSATGR